MRTKKLTLSKDTDLRKIAAETPGFTGADIANICNESALVASRKNKTAIEFSDFQDAVERIIAYHESGHAIVGYFTTGADPIRKVSIVPRGIDRGSGIYDTNAD